MNLKAETSARLHALQLDITNEHDIHSAFLYVNENLPDDAPGIYQFFLNPQYIPIIYK